MQVIGRVNNIYFGATGITELLKERKLRNYLDKVGLRRAMGYNTAPNIKGNAAPMGISAIVLESR